MNFSPIEHGTLEFKKCDLLKGRNLLGIDCGSTLTKVIFFHNNNEIQLSDDTIDFVTFNHGLFYNDDFKEAMMWTKVQAYLSKDMSCKIHITGNNASNETEFLESLFGLKVEYIDETLTIIAGHRIALEKIELESLRAPPVDVDLGEKIDNKLIEKFAKAVSSKFSKESSEGLKIFPCLLNVQGSLTRLYYFDEEGRGQMLGCPLIGGSSFMGLAKCLLDTNDYDEIIRLASTGNRNNLDTQIKEIMVEDPNSPYGKFPPELPLFSFGKCADYNKGLKDLMKEDISSSIVAFHSRLILTSTVHSCQMKGISKVFLSGSIFRSNLFQKQIKSAMMFPYGIKLEILDHGYFAALGAMFCNNDDKFRYFL